MITMIITHGIYLLLYIFMSFSEPHIHIRCGIIPNVVWRFSNIWPGVGPISRLSGHQEDHSEASCYVEIPRLGTLLVSFPSWGDTWILACSCLVKQGLPRNLCMALSSPMYGHPVSGSVQVGSSLIVWWLKVKWLWCKLQAIWPQFVPNSKSEIPAQFILDGWLSSCSHVHVAAIPLW